MRRVYGEQMGVDRHIGCVARALGAAGSAAERARSARGDRAVRLRCLGSVRLRALLVAALVLPCLLQPLRPARADEGELRVSATASPSTSLGASPLRVASGLRSALWLTRTPREGALQPRLALGLWGSTSVASAATVAAATQVQQLRLERPSLVPPLVVVALGVTATVVGTALSLRTMATKDDRGTAAWTGVLLLGGLGVSVGGAVWWRWVHDLRSDSERRERFLQLRAGL